MSGPNQVSIRCLFLCGLALCIVSCVSCRCSMGVDGSMRFYSMYCEERQAAFNFCLQIKTYFYDGRRKCLLHAYSICNEQIRAIVPQDSDFYSTCGHWSILGIFLCLLSESLIRKSPCCLHFFFFNSFLSLWIPVLYPLQEASPSAL